MHRFLALATVAAALFALPQLAAAGKPSGSASAASCSVSGTVVNAFGLPTDEVINFMIKDGSGTSGWVLGYTPDGAWSVTVPAANGPTTYQFASRTWGRDGAKYRVFASCS